MTEEAIHAAAEASQQITRDRDELLCFIFEAVTQHGKKSGRAFLLDILTGRAGDVARAYANRGFPHQTSSDIAQRLIAIRVEKASGEIRVNGKKPAARNRAELEGLQARVNEQLKALETLTQNQSDTISRLREETYNATEDSKAVRRQMEKQEAEYEADIKKLEAEIEQMAEQREAVESLMSSLSITLGGDGEWTHRMPPQPPPDSGCLYADVPALAGTAMGLVQYLQREYDTLVILLAGLNRCFVGNTHTSPELTSLLGKMREFLATADVYAVQQRHAARLAVEEATKKKETEMCEEVAQKMDTAREDYLKQVEKDAIAAEAHKRVHQFDDL